MTYKNTSQVLYKKQCPLCAKQGRDNSGNNLAVYADGGEYCWACSKAIKLSDTYKKQNNLMEFEIINERKF